MTFLSRFSNNVNHYIRFTVYPVHIYDKTVLANRTFFEAMTLLMICVQWDYQEVIPLPGARRGSCTFTLSPIQLLPRPSLWAPLTPRGPSLLALTICPFIICVWATLCFSPPHGFKGFISFMCLLSLHSWPGHSLALLYFV